MTQYKFTVGTTPQSLVGNLTWNTNGSLASQNITDPFNSANTQNCSYSHDDISRIASVNCGASKWQQNFTYDAFGKITKTVPGGATGDSFQATYSTATNRMTSVSSFTPTYDASGNTLTDPSHTYTWDVYGHPVTIDGVGLTYDAFGRMVEQNRSGAYTEINYAPTGDKIELMNGQSYTRAFLPLPGGAIAVYGGGPTYYGHPDHLGSIRLGSTSSRAVKFDLAHAPFGETYATSGTADPAFTGQRQDTVSGLYDFPAREYSIEGRWHSPDPAGLAAVDLSNPQSWNRFAYVRNSPLNLVDPLGLNGCNKEQFRSTEAFNAFCGGGGMAGGGFGAGCTLDGVYTPCDTVNRIIGQGAGSLCLSANCTVRADLEPTFGGVNIVLNLGPGFAVPAYPCPWGDCRTSPTWNVINSLVLGWVALPGTDGRNGGAGGRAAGPKNDTPMGMNIFNCPDAQGHDPCANIWEQAHCTIVAPAQDALGGAGDGAAFDIFKGAVTNPGNRLRGAAASLKEGTATFWFGMYSYGKMTLTMGWNMVQGCHE